MIISAEQVMICKYLVMAILKLLTRFSLGEFEENCEKTYSGQELYVTSPNAE
jgi:hypothetical protein